MFNKRGALELSINTIVVIVIGVTILVLGLAFVNKIFVKLDPDELIEVPIIPRGDVENLLTLTPRSLNIESGETQRVDVIIANREDNDYTQVIATAESLNPNDVECLFADTLKAQSKTYNLNSGTKIELPLSVTTTKASKLGDKVCGINVKGTGITDPDNEDSLFIKIV